MPSACVVTDTEGIIREANVAAGALFPGITLVGKPLVLRLSAPDRHRAHTMINQCGTSAATTVATVTLVVDPPLLVELRCRSVAGGHLVWLLRDVTAETAAATHLREAAAIERRTNGQLRLLDEARNAFVRAVSHDLQAPLAAISGLTGLLLDKPHIRATDRQAMLRQVSTAAALLLDQLRGLLDLERLGRGEVRLQRRRFDAAALVARATAPVHLGGRCLVVEVEPTQITVDPVVLESVARNLLVNAVDHTPESTTIWVRLSREPDGLLLVVEDDGPGVDAASRPHVFELFRRGDHTLVGGSGLGVGLALVREFAMLHGGYARLEERPGGGASFQVLLPEAPDPPGEPA